MGRCADLDVKVALLEFRNESRRQRPRADIRPYTRIGGVRQVFADAAHDGAVGAGWLHYRRRHWEMGNHHSAALISSDCTRISGAALRPPQHLDIGGALRALHVDVWIQFQVSSVMPAV